jgi:hypothetical protein
MKVKDVMSGVLTVILWMLSQVYALNSHKLRLAWLIPWGLTSPSSEYDDVIQLPAAICNSIR